MAKVRRETNTDVEAVREINTLAFEGPSEARIVDSLRKNCSDILPLVAEVDGKIVGHILFSPAVIEIGGNKINGMGLAPMSVLSEYRNKGVGGELINAGIKALKDTCPFIIVLGHADYYPRFGFERASKYGIRCEWEAPDEAFMIIVFDKEKMKGVKGTAKYRPEFAEEM
ncbi:MAG: N-acetyltransferase [Planctomycetota bacterium]|nr:MAG: N-acetyltransferase [Planctomycetota bacterium]